MKDYLGRSAFWNIAPRNRTQTAYTRFLKGPGAELKSQFTESVAAFKKLGENSLRTRYTEFLEDSDAIR
jgi:hypothetical protein